MDRTSLQLHLLDSAGTLERCREQIFGLAQPALKCARALLPLDRVDVVFYENPQFVIPPLGIGGYCSTPHTVFIALDSENPDLEVNLETDLAPTLAHELHHALRYRGPGYGDTLLGALVSEGLACHFERPFRCGRPPYYARALEPEQLAALTAEAEKEFGDTAYDHPRWFFGAGGHEVPFYAGYSIGYELVGRGLERLGESAATAYALPAERFLEVLTSGAGNNGTQLQQA